MLKTSANIELYFGYISDFSTDALIEILSPLEYQKVKSFRRKEDQQQSLISKAILKLLLGRYTSQPAESIQLNYGINGKPYIVDKSDIRFNLSHTGNALLIGFTKGVEIGVDIEQLNRTVNFSKITSILYSEKEFEYFNLLQDIEKHDSLIKSWSCKEAFMKAKGCGLAYPINQLELSLLDGEKVKILNTSWDSLEKEHWDLISFKVSNMYRFSIAAEGLIKINAIHKIAEINCFHNFLSHTSII